MKSASPAADTTIVVAEATTGPSKPMIFKILVWVTAVSLLACGTATFILNCMSYIGLSQAFVSFYLMAFGVIACLSQVHLAAIDKLFGILRSDNGMGLFFCFCGTLGLSFGIGSGANKLVPFISGACWLASGAVLVTGGAIFKCRSSNSASGAAAATA